MQIEFGEDTVAESPDEVRSVTAYRLANAVTDWSRVYSVRITLTLVSEEAVARPGDRLLRRFITNTIAVRNRLL